MEDEISSMAAVIGASAAGVKSMTATSGPGFSLKQENIGYAVPCRNSLRNCGCTAQRPLAPDCPPLLPRETICRLGWGTHGDHPMIALSPSSVKECYELTVRAFNLSAEIPHAGHPS